MIYVSWNGAHAYADWLKESTGKEYRLPTEAEWEYADGRPHEVGTKKKGNELGLYDMSGNVQEWVEDCSSEHYFRTPKDGSAWTKANCNVRGIRGGSWDTAVRVNQITARNSMMTKAWRNDVGFRLVYSEH